MNRTARGCSGTLKMDDTRRKLMKLALVCLICIGLISGLALLVQFVSR